MLEEVAKEEGIRKEKLERRFREGKVVILHNPKRDLKPIAIGEGLRVKVNTNVGTSPNASDLRRELEKSWTAVRCGTDTLMDLSVAGDLDEIRKEILRGVRVPVGTVPIYQAFVERGLDMEADYLLGIIEKHCKDGVEFMTLHAGLTLSMLEKVKRRLIPITSRGGSFLAAWMLERGEENPLYQHFDSVLDTLYDYGVVASLGDALRPGSVCDALDEAQLSELKTVSELVKKAGRRGVGAIVEGPGHVKLDRVEACVRQAKRVCDNAPLYVLGPIVTDIALGWDHVAAAIGGAVAAAAGADFLCYVTPSEHLGLPSVEDVKRGVMAMRVAAHAADIVRLKDLSKERAISEARGKLNWELIFELALDKEVASLHPELKCGSVCTMCGKYCALKLAAESLKKLK